VAGLCCRERPPNVNGWTQTSADAWCFDGFDKSTLIPYTTPISGGLAVTLGTFVAFAGSVSVVAQPATTSVSSIQIVPTNTDAVMLLGVSTVLITRIAGVSFTVNFGRGIAVGAETFSYQLIG
jgi:hypothetical protein